MAEAHLPIENTADFHDSRDILARIQYLRESFEDATGDDPDDYANMTADDYAFGLGFEDGQELESLEALIEQVRQHAGDSPEDGVTLLRDSYFEEYAEEYAYDTGAISREADWPVRYIDWEAAAASLLLNFFSVDFAGQTYYVRS